MMGMFYSKSSGAFYDAEIFPRHRMPADAVEIDAAHHVAMIKGQADGNEIVPDDGGRPVLRPRGGAQ